MRRDQSQSIGRCQWAKSIPPGAWPGGSRDDLACVCRPEPIGYGSGIGVGVATGVFGAGVVKVSGAVEV